VDPIGSSGIWRRVDLFEQAICVRANRGCRHATYRNFFSTVSRLGDGPLWYLLMLALAASSPANATVAARMAVVGLAGLGIYKLLKRRLVRERPYISHARISLGTAPLDRYSFPSGHTLHAVAFTQIATAHVPELAVVLVPFALLVAASRVVLGLHYPTDVAAGAVIGSLLASASFAVFPA
jgi:undecaprenyl-diphosphatase